MTDAGDEFLVGFIGCWPPDDGEGLTGAAMITNERGYPREFRVTTTVRPSAVQRALYGESLDRYLVVELIGKRLAAEMRQPLFVLSNIRQALEVDAPVPILFAAPADQMVINEGMGASYQRLEGAGIPRAIGLLGSNADAVGQATDRLKVAARYFDPLAAFDRMRTALKVLGESDARYR